MISVGDMVTCQYEDEPKRRIGRVIAIRERQGGFFKVYLIKNKHGLEWEIHEGPNDPTYGRNLKVYENSFDFIMKD